LLALLGAHRILHVCRVRVNNITFITGVREGAEGDIKVTALKVMSAISGKHRLEVKSLKNEDNTAMGSEMLGLVADGRS